MRNTYGNARNVEARSIEHNVHPGDNDVSHHTYRSQVPGRWATAEGLDGSAQPSQIFASCSLIRSRTAWLSIPYGEAQTAVRVIDQIQRSAEYPDRPCVRGQDRPWKSRRSGGNWPVRVHFRGGTSIAHVIQADMAIGRGSEFQPRHPGRGNCGRGQWWRRSHTDGGRPDRDRAVSCDRDGYSAGRAETPTGTESSLCEEVVSEFPGSPHGRRGRVLVAFLPQSDRWPAPTGLPAGFPAIFPL